MSLLRRFPANISITAFPTSANSNCRSVIITTTTVYHPYVLLYALCHHFFRGQKHQKQQQQQQQQQQGPSIQGVVALRSIVPPFDQCHHLPKTVPAATNTITNAIHDDAILLSNVTAVDDSGNHPAINASLGVH